MQNQIVLSQKKVSFSVEKLMVELLYITLICPLGDVVCLWEAFEEKEGCANQLVDFPDVEQLTREQRSGKTLSIGHRWMNCGNSKHRVQGLCIVIEIYSNYMSNFVIQLIRLNTYFST